MLVDGAVYLRNKCMNKIFSSSTEFLSIIDSFLATTNKSTSLTFFSNFLNEAQSLQLLTKFKFCLLDLFKDLKPDAKQHFLDITMNLFLNICNFDLSKDTTSMHTLFEKIVVILANNYFVTVKSSQYFVKNEKHFDYLLGYLNRTSQRCLTISSPSQDESKIENIINLFSQTLIEKLSDASGLVREFFSKLSDRMQNDLVKCFFDIWLSSSVIGSALVKKCLVAFQLDSKHLLSIFHERVHLKIVKGTDEKAATTKQMKKQLKQFNANNLVELDWKCLKYLLEFLQFFFR